MDKCSKKDCVDFDVPKEDQELAGACEMCNNNRQNPKWATDISQYLKLAGNIVNPTDDVPLEPDEIALQPEILETFTSYVDETAEIPPSVFEAFRTAAMTPASTHQSELEMDNSKMMPIKDIKDSGKRTEFETGAVRDAQGGKGRFDLIPNMAVWALAHHTEKGCGKYGDRNWEKGIPIKNFIDSAKRHLTEFELGLTDENHLAAALWNVACCYETMLRIDMGILPESLDEDLAYPLRGVIQDSEMVMAWDRLRHPKLKV